MSHKQELKDKFQCNFIAETDHKLQTFIVMKHFEVNYSGARNFENFECNECDNYFDIREAIIRHMRKRGKYKNSV